MNPVTSVFQLTLHPRVLIEANAGTGKTYTIQGLALRLLVEHRLSLPQILIVTFTKMATQELRSRLLGQLQTALELITNDWETQDTILGEWRQWHRQHPESEALLRKAIRQFDDASVFTIHGFCQKVLSDYPMLTGVQPGMVVDPGNDPYSDLVIELWRDVTARFSADVHRRELLEVLLGHFEDPSTLLKRMKPLLSKAEYAYPAPFFNPSQLQELFEGEDNADWVDLQEQNTLSPAFLQYSASKVLDLHLRRRLERGQLGYDDLLTMVGDALKKPVSGSQLINRLRRDYRFALVDEFQDTDPIQYEIFNALFPVQEQGDGRQGDPSRLPSQTTRSLFLIGDPKQAIYQFRGADVYTYLKAKRSVPESARYSLASNFRSREELIRAANRLFIDNPFGMADMTYVESRAGKREHPSEWKFAPKVPLSFHCFTGPGLAPITKTLAQRAQMKELVRQVSELLTVGRSPDSPRPLKGSDIAILVNRNQSAIEVQNALLDAGVSSVSLSRESIYGSMEALKLLYWMEAVLRPGSKHHLGKAVLSGFLGWDLNRLHALLTGEGEHSSVLASQESIDPAQKQAAAATRPGDSLADHFALARERWNKEGFAAMMFEVLYVWHGMARLAENQRGERMISNVLQLVEECHAVERERAFSPSELLKWLRDRIRQADDRNEEEENRLETDEDLVRIMTVHKSKGLEFPIVFLPDLWSASAISDTGQTVEYHEEQGDGYRLRLGLHEKDHVERRATLDQSHEEARLEDVRKAYVGITRASVECRIFWAPIGRSGSPSGLNRILETIADPQVGPKEGTKPSIDAQLRAFDVLKEDASEWLAIHWVECDENGETKPSAPQAPTSTIEAKTSTSAALVMRPYEGPSTTPAQKGIFSFSALFNSSTDVQHTDPESSKMKQDILEGLEEHFGGVNEEQREETALETDYLHLFPPGNSTGSLLHEFLEDDRFAFAVPLAEREDPIWRDQQTAWIGQLLSQKGYKPVLAPFVLEMMDRVRGCSIPDLDLSMVMTKDQIREMEFHLPVGRVESTRILSIIREASDAVPRPPVLQPMSQNTHPTGSPHPRSDSAPYIRNYLKGFIDLIVRQGDKYFILDYKSNALNTHPDPYSQQALADSVYEHFYDVQYHFYLVALVRHLSSTLPNFNYETHIGGVAYLFLRGLQTGTSNGVWYARPSKQTIDTLEQEFQR